MSVVQVQNLCGRIVQCCYGQQLLCMSILKVWNVGNVRLSDSWFGYVDTDIFLVRSQTGTLCFWECFIKLFVESFTAQSVSENYSTESPRTKVSGLHLPQPSWPYTKDTAYRSQPQHFKCRSYFHNIDRPCLENCPSSVYPGTQSRKPHNNIAIPNNLVSQKEYILTSTHVASQHQGSCTAYLYVSHRHQHYVITLLFTPRPSLTRTCHRQFNSHITYSPTNLPLSYIPMFINPYVTSARLSCIFCNNPLTQIQKQN